MLNKILLISFCLIPLNAIADENQLASKRSTGFSTGLGIVGGTGYILVKIQTLPQSPYYLMKEIASFYVGSMEA